MAYKIALFDADNTLLDFTRAEYEAICQCLSSRSLPTDHNTICTYSAINDSHWKCLERGETTRERLKIERFSDFFRAIGHDGDPQIMARDYEATLSCQSFLLDGALELIQNLHNKCRLFIVTNGITTVQKKRFANCLLAPYFEKCFISEEMGCAKPEKIFFERIAHEIQGFDPIRTIVIGDSLSSDIQGGINAELDTCWYNPMKKAAPSNMSITYTVHTLADIRKILLK